MTNLGTASVFMYDCEINTVVSFVEVTS